MLYCLLQNRNLNNIALRLASESRAFFKFKSSLSTASPSLSDCHCRTCRISHCTVTAGLKMTVQDTTRCPKTINEFLFHRKNCRKPNCHRRIDCGGHWWPTGGVKNGLPVSPQIKFFPRLYFFSSWSLLGQVEWIQRRRLFVSQTILIFKQGASVTVALLFFLFIYIQLAI